MDLIFALIALMTWLAASRWLFRRWVRNDSLTKRDARCSCGYRHIHRDEPCRGYTTMKPWGVATCAAGAGLVLPVVLFMLAIMCNPPVSRRELAERTASLEKECEQLRKAQARQEPGECEYGDH